MEKKRVIDYMTHNVVYVNVTDTIGDVINQIRTTKHDGFPVVQNNKVIGYISARDIIGEHPLTIVNKCMSRHPLKATPNLTITEVARRIFRSGIQKLPVVDDENTLIGIISNLDVIRSQIERVTPEKVFKFLSTLHILYNIDPVLTREQIPVNKINPTQSCVYLDELEGRIYELKNHLAEPIIAVRSGDRIILVDGHHRAVAAHKIGIEYLDAYVLSIDSNIQLGLEKTAHSMNIYSLNDVKIDENTEYSLIEPTHQTLISTENKSVSEYMTTSVLVIQNNGTVKDVIQLIRSTSHDGFPVVNTNNNIVGYIAARNIVGYSANDKIEPLMDTNTFHIHPNNSMQDVARKMFRSCIQKVPIIDNQNKLVGIITNSDVIRSQIERVTPEKVFEYIQTLKKLYKIQPQLSRGMVLVNSLIPTQSKVYIDELDERSYEIINGLVEPLLVVHWNKKYILVDGHHRAVAALKMGIKELESYIIEVDSDIVLGIEKTSRNMHLLSLNDVKILDESHCDFLK